MTESEISTKSGRSRRGSGNAVPSIERMRAYRARKAAERLAAGLPLPKPGRPSTKPAKPAEADAGALAKIAELEALNRRLADDLEDAKRSAAYHRGEIQRLEREIDSRGTSILKGKPPARKHREAALTEWVGNDTWHGQERVKTLRTNISRAHSTIDDLRTILGRYDGAKLGYDIDVLIAAQQVLGAYKSGMDGAGAHAASNKYHAEKAVKAREMAEREKVAVRLFGTATPAAEDVKAMANDFLAYDEVADAWLKQKHRTKEAYSAIQSTYTLRSVLEKPAALRDELLRLATEMPGRGRHRTYDLDAGSCWFGGLEDFEAWRATK
jgi:hypothetical protein